MPKTTKIEIDLNPPYRVNGRPARFQSLWFLLRVFHAHMVEETDVPVSMLQARFPGNANLRMMVSRAFRDFDDWGVTIGWGAERVSSPSLLAPTRRSQGPFWMHSSTAARLSPRVNGRRADMPALTRFLALDEAKESAGGPVDYAMQDVAYWCELTQAMRVAQDGFSSSSGSTVAAGFRAARKSAQDDFQTVLALLKESLAWRKHGHLDRGREALDRLDAHNRARDRRSATPTLSAMAFVARGWDWYSRGKTVAARAELDRLAADPELQLVVRYNPRVRFEYLNLLALLHKAIALNDRDSSGAQRVRSAEQALCALSGALQAAYEADSIEAAQDVAANMGLTLWLCWKNRLIDGKRAQSEFAVQTQAIRWLGLSEWICDRFGVGGDSAWNTIFLLRIARGGCATEADDEIASFRRQTPLSVKQVIEATRPFHAAFSAAKGYVRWSTVASYALEEHDAGRAHYGALQVANLLLEAAWFHAHEDGLCKEAYSAVERLGDLVAQLQPKERLFFRESLKSLPRTLQDACRDRLRRRAR